MSASLVLKVMNAWQAALILNCVILENTLLGKQAPAHFAQGATNAVTVIRAFVKSVHFRPLAQSNARVALLAHTAPVVPKFNHSVPRSTIVEPPHLTRCVAV